MAEAIAMNSAGRPSVAIIGGGWAGLSAAVELSRQGCGVSLFESAPQLGGRARGMPWKDMQLDNGQHLVIGAYQQLLSLLDVIGADSHSLLQRLPHRLLMKQARSGTTLLDLNLPTFPAPFHLLFGVFQAQGLNWKQKLRVLLRFNRLLNTPINDDLPVSDWLASAGLPAPYVDYLLRPVCLAALTTHPEQASARAFQSVLQQTFNAPADHTDLLLPATDLGQLFPEQAARYIRQQGGEVHCGHRLEKLTIKQQCVDSIVINGEEYRFDQVILATPPLITARLLGDDPQTEAIGQQIEQLEYEPVTTLYLQFDRPVKLQAPMIGLLNGTAEWIFERAISGHPEVLAVVISASGAHQHLDPDELSSRVLEELAPLLTGSATLVDCKRVSEKRATFRCHPDVDRLRPKIETPLSNLKLCGDYVYIEQNNQPGLPSTLEGAVRSGVKCAHTLMQSFNP